MESSPSAVTEYDMSRGAPSSTSTSGALGGGSSSLHDREHEHQQQQHHQQHQQQQQAHQFKEEQEYILPGYSSPGPRASSINSSTVDSLSADHRTLSSDLRTIPSDLRPMVSSDHRVISSDLSCSPFTPPVTSASSPSLSSVTPGSIFQNSAMSIVNGGSSSSTPSGLHHPHHHHSHHLAAGASSALVQGGNSTSAAAAAAAAGVNYPGYHLGGSYNTYSLTPGVQGSQYLASMSFPSVVYPPHGQLLLDRPDQYQRHHDYRDLPSAQMLDEQTRYLSGRTGGVSPHDQSVMWRPFYH